MKYMSRLALVLLVISCVYSSSEQVFAAFGNDLTHIDESLYVLTRNHYAEGFTPKGHTARFGDLIMIEILSGKSKEPAYQEGKDYRLYSGGEYKGKVKITSVVPLQCNSEAAVVEQPSYFHFGNRHFALVTNSNRLKTHGSFQTSPSDDEKSLALKIAAQQFHQHGSKIHGTSKITIDSLVFTSFGVGKPKAVVGSFILTTQESRDHIFLIAELKGKTYQPVLVNYHQSKDLENGTDEQTQRFADQLDLNGDGTDEIVVEITGYEYEAFWIYKEYGGTWKKIATGGAGGC